MAGARSSSKVIGGFYGLPNELDVPEDEWTGSNSGMGVKLVQSGSAALRVVLEQIERRGSSILVPEYLCASVDSAIRQAGFIPLHYPQSRTLEPILPALAELLNESVSAVITTRFFGVATSKLEEIRHSCDNHGVPLIEDCVGVAAPFEMYGGEVVGRYAFNSLRKFLPLPDGAEVLGCAIPQATSDSLAGMQFNLAGIQAMRQIENVRREFPGSRLEFEVVETLQRCEDALHSDSDPRYASDFAHWAVTQLDFEEIVSRRSENYMWLKERIGEGGLANGRVLPLFDRQAFSLSPLFFPVKVLARRDELRGWLAEDGIYCPVHWPIQYSEYSKLTPQMKDLARTQMSLPVDQRLCFEDLERLVRRLEDFYEV